MATIELERLITRSSAGDTDSFRDLVAHLDSKLFAYVCTRLKSRDEAIELVQDVLVDVWKSLRTFRYTSDAGFYRFVYTIAKRHLYRAWRAPITISLDSLPPLADEQTIELVRLSSISRWAGVNGEESGERRGMEETGGRGRHDRAVLH